MIAETQLCGGADLDMIAEIADSVGELDCELGRNSAPP
jgi:hypothetical protein